MQGDPEPVRRGARKRLCHSVICGLLTAYDNDRVQKPACRGRLTKSPVLKRLQCLRMRGGAERERFIWACAAQRHAPAETAGEALDERG